MKTIHRELKTNGHKVEPDDRHAMEDDDRIVHVTVEHNHSVVVQSTTIEGRDE